MTLIQSQSDKQWRLVVSGSFTIFQAADYKAQLLDVLEQTETLLEMDLTAIEEIDTAGLQLLLMLQQEAQAQGKQVFFTGVSTAMKNVIDILQLHHRFNCLGDNAPVPTLAAQAQR